MARLLERIDARLNPLMVKEAQQSLRSRPLVVGGFLALAVPLLLFLFRMAATSFTTGENDSAGRDYFWMIAGTAAIVALGIVPARATQQLHAEIKSRTIDLITLSGLSPWQLATGRFEAAALQIALVLAFLSPFALASIMMGGIGLREVATALATIVCVALTQVAGGLLAASAQLVSPRLGPLALAGFGIQLFFFGSVWLGFMFEPVSPEPALLVWLALLLALFTLLLLRVSADILTPAGSRNSAWSKLLLVLLLALLYVQLWSGDALVAPTSSSDNQSLLLLMGMLLLHMFVLVWSSADSRPGPGPRGIRFVLADGCEPTLAYGVLVALAIAGAAAARDWPAWLPPLFSVYLIFFCGLAALIRTFLPRTPDAYFMALLVCIIADLVATAVYESIFVWGPKTAPSMPTAALLVLMPLTWDESSVAQERAYFALPLLIGLGALALAYTRRARLAGSAA